MGLAIKTDQTSQSRTQDDFQRVLQSGFDNLLNTLNALKRLVWSNSYGLTPQQVLDLVGSADAHGSISAAAMFAAAAKAAELLSILGKDVGAIQPDTFNATINNDGTVTVTPK